MKTPTYLLLCVVLSAGFHDASLCTSSRSRITTYGTKYEKPQTRACTQRDEH